MPSASPDFSFDPVKNQLKGVSCYMGIEKKLQILKLEMLEPTNIAFFVLIH